LALHDFQREAIYSELSDILSASAVSVRASDRLIYATDWSWMSQVWLDRGEQPPTADFVVHPGSAAEIASLPGVRSSAAVNGEVIVSLEPGVDRRDFLRGALQRYEIQSFSQREPELEEIYLAAVHDAGIEETRIIE